NSARVFKAVDHHEYPTNARCLCSNCASFLGSVSTRPIKYQRCEAYFDRHAVDTRKQWVYGQRHSWSQRPLTSFQNETSSASFMAS
ncbi:hypothetical protein BX616_005639, partial [Lobosporangium transversale]